MATATIIGHEIKSEILDKPHIIYSSSDGGFIKIEASCYNPTVLSDGRTRQVVQEIIFVNPNPMYVDIVRNRKSIHTRPGSVTVVDSQLCTGLNEYSGRRWYRWTVTSIYSWFTTSRGNIATLAKSKFKKRKALMPFHWSGSRQTILARASNAATNEALDAAQTMIFGKVLTMSDTWPVASIFCNGSSYYELPSILAFKRDKNRLDRYSNDPKAMLMAITGGVYTKALLKAARGTSPIDIARVSAFNISVDLQVRILESIKGETHTWYSLVDPDVVMSMLDSNQRKAFFNKYLASSDRGMTNDIARLIRRLENYDVDYSRALKEPTLRRIHDAMISLNNAVRTAIDEKNSVSIDCWDRPELNMDLGGGIRIYLAENTLDMVRWGTMFNHCIGSSIHTERITDDNIYGILERDGKPIGNFNITADVLTQAYGANNTPIEHLDPEAHQVFIQHLERSGIKPGWKNIGYLRAENIEVGRIRADAIYNAGGMVRDYRAPLVLDL